jgi:putative effector of murein hydrolase
MPASLFSHPLFGLAECILAYSLGLWINRKIRSPLTNPLCLAIAALIAAHYLAGIPYGDFNQGGRVLTMLLPPAIAGLAVIVHRQRSLLRTALLPLLAGCVAGSAASVASVYLLGRALGLDRALLVSLLPKSVTAPIAASLASGHGGAASIAAAAVIFTGMLGSMGAPFLCRLFRVADPLIQGVAIGTSSHAVGTARAVELGEVQGAASSVAIAVAGLATSCLFMLLA